MMRRFELHRDVDVTGMSGVGVVADGILWPNGTASVLWRGEHQSIVYWPDGFQHAAIVHGHGGATRFVFLDEEETEPAVEVTADEELPHGGTVFDLRVSIAHQGAQADRSLREYRLIPDAAVWVKEVTQMVAAGGCNSWALASLLKWLEVTHGVEAAYEAACLVQIIGVDGGDQGYCGDIPSIAASEAAQ